MDPREKTEISELEKFWEKYELDRVQSHVGERIVTLVIAALGLIAALAWDDALKHLFENLFGGAGSLWEQLSYAVIITVLAAAVSVWLGKRITARERRRKE
jgi:hypothetical protein